jgi:hypothetical protein
MVRIVIDHRMWRTARDHLDGHAERVGFFLADWSAPDRSFGVRDWQPIHDGTEGVGGDLHVSLSDETRTSILRWATLEEASLIEAHSHGRRGPAVFSRYDLRGLAEWVPHVRWRLRGRAYAALVTTVADFDALAWVDDSQVPCQVEGVAESVFRWATGETIRRYWNP